MDDESKICVKSKKRVFYSTYVFLIGAIVLFFVLKDVFNDFVRFMIIICVPVFSVYAFSVQCRKYIFDETGCTVELLWIKKHYS